VPHVKINFPATTKSNKATTSSVTKTQTSMDTTMAETGTKASDRRSGKSREGVAKQGKFMNLKSLTRTPE